MPTPTNGLKPGEFGLHFTEDGEALQEGQHWENTPVAYIGWHREGDHGGGDEGCVQIHLIVDADEVVRAADEIRRCRANPDVPGYPNWTFSTTVLDRREMQKAIKTIRRARDTAYGSDE